MAKLPLLYYVSTSFSKIRLDNMLVIACQHILETNYTMFEYLFEKGLKPNNTFLLGKCYSTNKDVLKRFQKKGVHVHKGSIAYDSYKGFDEQFEEQVIDFIKQFKRMKLEEYEKIIILDDGGYLVYWANTLLKNLKNVVAVEQTSSGYVKLKNLKLNFPVINVARSEAKLKFESPFIAETAIFKLKERLSKFKLSPKNVLVIGNGSVGRNVSNILKREFEVKHYDLDNSLSDFKNKDLSSIISQFDMIVGCTGEAVIKKEQFNLLKRGVVLVSISSSDREFSASKLRKLTDKNKDCHLDLKINGLVLINSGFPVNFDGKPHSAEPEKIQLTRALIFSAVCLGVLNKYPVGLIDLGQNIQTKIISTFNKI